MIDHLGEALTLASYVTAAGIFWWASLQRGTATEGSLAVLIAAFVGGIFGAKVAQGAFQGTPMSILDPRVGGRALLGGIAGGWIAVAVVKRRLGYRRSTGDQFALALAGGEAIGRIGCHFNGCCYGTECALPWAIYQHGAMRHPAQIYSSLTAAALFAFLLWVRRKITGEGILFRLYLLGFGVSRFLLEFVRWRESVVFGLSPMQWFCLAIVVAVLAYTLLFDVERLSIGGGAGQTET